MMATGRRIEVRVCVCFFSRKIGTIFSIQFWIAMMMMTITCHQPSIGNTWLKLIVMVTIQFQMAYFFYFLLVVVINFDSPIVSMCPCVCVFPLLTMKMKMIISFSNYATDQFFFLFFLCHLVRQNICIK